MSAVATTRSAGVSAAPRALPQEPARGRARIGAEERLLLLTAGGPANDPAIRQRAREGVDWSRFLGLAQVERAVPVIYRRLSTVAPDLMSGEVLEQMRRLALISDFAMMHLEGRLRESLQALHRARVRVMLLKGAALAHSAYGGVLHRPMSDIDILVDPSDAYTARRTMLDVGWREIVGGIPESVYERHHHLPPLYDARSPQLQLEIHTALFPERQPFAFDAHDVWARARPVGAMFPEAVVPDPLDALLHTCLHFFWSHQGRFGVWRTIRDIDAISTTGAIDWTAFVNTARAARGSTSCYWALRIAQVTAGVAVPRTVVDALRPRRRPFLLQAIERHFLMNLFPVGSTCPSVRLEHLLWEFAVMPSSSGHGTVRPWDDEAKFVAQATAGDTKRTVTRHEGFRRLLAFPVYIASLLRALP